MNATTTTLSTAAAVLEARLVAASSRERPILTVHTLIDRRMAAYGGRDVAIGQRLGTWQHLIGKFALEEITIDLMREAREVLKSLPALAYKGLDSEGRPIFKSKSRHRVKTGATINRYMAAISGAFTWAIEEGLAPRDWQNPCRGIRRMQDAHERVRFLSADERARLFDACKASEYPRLYALVLTAMLSGARRGELLALRWKDVDLAKGVALLSRSKNGDRGSLVLLPQVCHALRPFQGEQDRLVFGSVRSRYQAPANFETAFKHARARAEISDFRFHDLRHCCASYLAQAGKPLNVIKEVLRHRKIDMTLRYAHLTVDTKADAMHDALSEIGHNEPASR